MYLNYFPNQSYKVKNTFIDIETDTYLDYRRVKSCCDFSNFTIYKENTNITINKEKKKKRKNKQKKIIMMILIFL